MNLFSFVNQTLFQLRRPTNQFDWVWNIVRDNLIVFISDEIPILKMKNAEFVCLDVFRELQNTRKSM